MLTRFDSIAEMAQAIRAGKVPTRVVSPGLAAAAFGITRQAVWQRIQAGKLRAWWAEGVILIDVDELPPIQIDKVKKRR